MTEIDPNAAKIAEADRLIASALADHIRTPAPRRLRQQLAREHLTARRPWWTWAASFAFGAVAATVIALVVVRPTTGTPPEQTAMLPRHVEEAVGDHLRIVGAAHPLDVVASDMHQVKPWFTGKLDFVPPLSFLGDDEFPLRGGSLAVFLGHKAAALVYGRRLHTISLFVFADPIDRPRQETIASGFHVLSWANNGFGMALVSDVAWDDLRVLEARVRQQP